MTVSAQTPLNSYTANGVTTVFAFSFLLLADTDLVVEVDDLSGNPPVVKTLGVDYTVAGVGVGSGGTVTFLAAPASTYIVTIYRDTALTRSTDYQTNGDWLASVVNGDFDRIWLALQELNGGGAGTGGALRVPASETVSRFPAASLRIGKFAAFDAAGDATVSAGTGADAGLRTDLAASGGSALVAFLAGGTGAVARTLQARMRDTVSAFDFMTAAQIADVQAGTALLNVTAALQAAIDSLGSGGGRLYLPPGVYGVTDHNSDGACLKVVNPIQIVGAGAFRTAIRPLATVSAAVNTIWFSPAAGVDCSHSSVQDLFIGNPNAGTRVGNAGIYLDTLTAGRNLPRFLVRGCYIGQGSGVGIYHQNNAANNINGGMYCSLFYGNSVSGGIRLDETGDSNSIVHNILTGTGHGVLATVVAGASCLEIQANNITTTKGAIHLDSGSRFRIIGNNIEHSAVGAAASNDSAIIDITGTSGTMYGGVIKENLISGFGATDATRCISMDNCRGTSIRDNVFLSGAAGLVTGIVIGGSSANVRVGPNTYNAAITTKVTETASGTAGIVKTPTLLNSWEAWAVGHSTLKYVKSDDGMVHVFGVLKNGVTANGTNLAVLPTGFRPAENMRFMGLFMNAGVATLCEINLDSSGNLSINYVTASTQLNIDITFPASGLGDAVSLE